MGRKPKPLDPGQGPIQRFAHDLRRLREDAGEPTYRQMAARVHTSASALSIAASGDRLPSLMVTLAYVRACGGDPGVWEARWHELSAALAAELAAGRAPAAHEGTRGSADGRRGDVDGQRDGADVGADRATA
ncbi:helix-turn-helix domain-containing protein, partial [Microbispora sp. ATCC PTA-5024]|uniref:helix-turn-helix domain-containing protein n=1 Tax=Microbispora sp. ATCC PTA-5024 TaxID=316330 RepID=UPI0003DC5CF8